MKVVAIGEVLWDVFKDSEELGGATFNFSVHASRLGHDVTFVSAVGDDERGRAALLQARQLGIGTKCLQTVTAPATGYVTVYLDSKGQPDFTIHRPAAYDAVQLDSVALTCLAAMRPDWLYFGTLHQSEESSRIETRKLLDALPNARRFYDINLRRNCYTPALLAELMPLAQAVKLSDSEADELDAMFGWRHASLAEFTEDLSVRFGWHAVAVTRGSKGCAVRIGDEYAECEGYAVEVADTVGAGDAFSAAFLHGLSQGWGAERSGDFANRVGAVVASRHGGTPEWSVEECLRLG